MKSFRNHNPKDWGEASRLLSEAADEKRAVSVVGGGSDLIAQVKDGLVAPEVIVNLKSLPDGRRIERRGDRVAIGGLVTLDELSRHPLIRQHFRTLAEAAGSVATPQIRSVATLAGNLCQRPWCWYYRQGFPCFKNGGDACYSVVGDNRFNAIFGGGPSYIVHPSDTAPALLALDAEVRIFGLNSERTVKASEFFVLPDQDVQRENVLERDELVAEVLLPYSHSLTISGYHKIMDRKAWTHAVVSAAVALSLKDGVCSRARLALGGVAPIPWRLPAVEAMLTDKKITPEVAERAGRKAVEDASPLSNNRYKVPLTRALVKRSLLTLVQEAA